MRVTQGMLTQQFLYNITNTNNNMQNLENELSTGKVLNEPSDDPLAVSQDMAIQSALSDANGYQSTVSAGLTWMNNTSSTLQSMITSLEAISNNVEAAINGTNQSPNAEAASAATVQQLVNGIYQLLDTQQGDSYLFGGTNTTSQPSKNLTAATGDINYEISYGVNVTVNVTAAQLFLSQGSQVQGNPTQDLQDTLSSIVADLGSGNTTNLQTDLQNLSDHINNVISINATVGSTIQRLTSMQSQLSQYTTSLTTEKGVIEDANMAQVITQFNTDQTVYTAALQMGASILQPSLVSYLPNG